MSEALKALMTVEDSLSHIRDVADNLPSTAFYSAEESLALVPKLEAAIFERDKYLETLKSLRGYLSNWALDVECGLKPTPGSLRSATEEVAAALKGGAA